MLCCFQSSVKYFSSVTHITVGRDCQMSMFNADLKWGFVKGLGVVRKDALTLCASNCITETGKVSSRFRNSLSALLFNITRVKIKGGSSLGLGLNFFGDLYTLDFLVL